MASPAFALGLKTNGTITGKSWTVSQSPCTQTCAFTTSQAGSISIMVQLTSAGALVAGTKVTSPTGSPGTYQTASSFYVPGGRHTGGGTTLNT